MTGFSCATASRAAGLLAVSSLLLPGPAAGSDDPIADRVVVNVLPAAQAFFSLLPCRAVDTRVTGGPLVAGTPRTFTLWNACGIPSSAAAVSINVAVTQPT